MVFDLPQDRPHLSFEIFRQEEEDGQAALKAKNLQAISYSAQEIARFVEQAARLVGRSKAAQEAWVWGSGVASADEAGEGEGVGQEPR